MHRALIEQLHSCQNKYNRRHGLVEHAPARLMFPGCRFLIKSLLGKLTLTEFYSLNVLLLIFVMLITLQPVGRSGQLGQIATTFWISVPIPDVTLR